MLVDEDAADDATTIDVACALGAWLSLLEEEDASNSSIAGPGRLQTLSHSD